MRHRGQLATRTGVLALLVIAVYPWTAQAQTAAQGQGAGGSGISPGASPETPAQRQVLTLRASMAESQDLERYPRVEQMVAGTNLYSTSAWFDGDLQYGTRGKKMTFGSYAAARGRYDQRMGEVSNIDYFGAASWGWGLGRKTRMSLRQGVSRSTSYLSRLIPVIPVSENSSEAASTPAGYLMTPNPALRIYETSTGLDYGMSRRGSLRTHVAVRYAQSPSATLASMRSESAGAGYHYVLSRNATVRLDYTFRRGRYDASTAPRAVAHDVDIGIDYRRPLSLSRRTTVSFATGSSFVDQAERPVDQLPGQYRVNGDIALSHQLGRTWRAQLAYHRGLGFYEGFVDPVASNDVTASMQGRVGRRVELGATAGASKGDVSGHGRFTIVTGSATARVPVTRVLAMYGLAYLDAYHPERADVSTPGLTKFQHYGIQVGLSLVAPLVRR